MGEEQLKSLASAVFDPADKRDWRRKKNGQQLSEDEFVKEMISDKQTEARWIKRINEMTETQKILFARYINQIFPKVISQNRPSYQMAYVLCGTLAMYETALPDQKASLERDLAESVSLVTFLTDPNARGNTFYMESPADESKPGKPGVVQAYRIADPESVKNHPDLWRYSNVVQTAINRAKTGWGNQLRPDQLDAGKVAEIQALVTNAKYPETLNTFNDVLTPDQKNQVISFYNFAKRELEGKAVDPRTLRKVVGAYISLLPLIKTNVEYVEYYEANKRPSPSRETPQSRAYA